MEVCQYLEKREVKINKVFSRKPTNEPINDLSQSFRKLGYIFEKKIKTWWDITSFEQYLSARLIPRRLWWDVPSNHGLLDELSMSEWSDFFTKKG